jgi:hypothetical protein
LDKSAAHKARQLDKSAAHHNNNTQIRYNLDLLQCSKVPMLYSTT